MGKVSRVGHPGNSKPAHGKRHPSTPHRRLHYLTWPLVLLLETTFIGFSCSGSSFSISFMARLNSRSPLPSPLAMSGIFSPPKKKTAISRISIISCTPKPNIPPPAQPLLSARLQVHAHHS